MDDIPPQENQIKFLLSDFNTRLRDLDERNKLIRERVLLLGKNLISSRQDIETELKEIKKGNQEIKKDLERIKRTSNSLLTEFNKFVKREELALVERMLKDFQPLEFMRKKDVEELIENKINIKTTKTTL
jgi:predicted  nucleic acid-binding Zn-ribbon protein